MMNHGEIAEIIEYRTNKDIDVRFDGGHIRKNVDYKNYKRGSILNLYYPRIYGVGCVGEAKTRDGYGNKFPSYITWHSMMTRCYSSKYQENQPTYKACEVCDEWKCYENFKIWYDNNYYEIDGHIMELDKDILIKGNKIYSPNTCIFIPKDINVLFKGYGDRKYNLPMGVTFKSDIKKYQATLTYNNIRKYIGVYPTPEEAFNAYKEFKENYIKEVAEDYKSYIPERLYNALINYKVDITD